MSLNNEQQQAVDYLDGACVVVATPGSGKTKTLTSRVISLIKNRTNPSNILCLTFTNKAANEMRERISSEIGASADSVFISTFHSFFLAVLRRYGKEVGLMPGFSVYGDADQRELIEKIARMHEYQTNSRGINMIMKAANDFRENIISFESICNEIKPIEAEIVREYINTISEFNAVDFSGILYSTYSLLKNNPKAAEVLANRFKYILIDEWQDTNTIQYETIKMIASYHNNLFVVCDPQQSIFSWRGAKPENINRVKKDFPNVKEIVLPRNYRSTRQILENAERLIKHNHDAQEVKLISEVGDGDPVSFMSFDTPEHESSMVANTIFKLVDKHGFSWKDCAVIYRMNMLSKTQEIELRKIGIPYKIHGGFSFFDRKEIKTTISYLKFVSNSKDTHAFTKAIKTPVRGVGDTTVGRLERYCQEQKVDMLTACKNYLGIKMPQAARDGIEEFTNIIEKYKNKDLEGCPLHEVAWGLLNDSGYYKYMKEESEKDQDWQKRIDNVNELLVDIRNYGTKNPKARLADYLQTMELITSDDKEDEDNSVSLLTMHSAKGLEFPVVFLIGIEKDIIPHKSALAEGGENEERRLMYVACTRAKKLLFISHSHTRQKWKEGTKQVLPSPFLYEMSGY